MRTRASDARESLVLGHRLDVHRDGELRWRVMVDGDELPTLFAHPYAAWAVGAAESYRRGRTPGISPRDD